jgi:hypothetical protein
MSIYLLLNAVMRIDDIFNILHIATESGAKYLIDLSGISVGDFVLVGAGMAVFEMRHVLLGAVVGDEALGQHLLALDEGDQTAHVHGIIIEADIPVSSVDWVMSMVMNANPEYEEEKEIRIFENAPVNIIAIK